METCANPGCSEPGTNKCAGCKTTPYCGPICQTAHWLTHKESCDGRLRKVGMDHLHKAQGFHRENNWSQALRYCDLALTKLKQLKDRPIEEISIALGLKVEALGYLNQYKEQLECAQEWYCLWNTKPTDVGAIQAALALIHGCLTNNKIEDAYLYASTLWEIINHKHDNKIPESRRELYIAEGADSLARATYELAVAGGIPPEEKRESGEEVIALSRRALEIYTLLFGTEKKEIADHMTVLANAMDYFHDYGDDDVILLYQQSITIYSRTQGNTTLNVATTEFNLGNSYYNRARRELFKNDLDHQQKFLELALPHLREALRIYRAINRSEGADDSNQLIISTEEALQQIALIKSVVAASRG